MPEQQNEKPKPMVGVSVLIRKGDRILMEKRKKDPMAGSWTAPGGHMDFGESPEQTAAREVQEELGITIDTIKFRAITNDVFEEEHIVLGVRGVTNIMKYLGMLEGDVVPPDRPQITLYGSHLDNVYANQGGIWVPEVQGGERVHKSQSLGLIYSLRTFEIVERPAAPYDGYVLGTADMPIVNVGDSLTAICHIDD